MEKNNLQNIFVIFLMIIIICVLVIVVGCSKSATPEEIKIANDLTAEGFSYIESWAGDGDILDKAEAVFNEALSINENCADAYAGLGFVELYNGYYSGTKFEESACKRALEYALKALNIDRDSINAHKLKGRALTYLGDCDEALKEAEIIESIDKLSCEQNDLRGIIYQVQGDRDGAIAEFVNETLCPVVISNKVRLAKIYNRLGGLYNKKGDFENASASYEKSIEANPYVAWTYGNYCSSLLSQYRLDEAEAMAQKALTIADYPQAHSCLENVRSLKAPN